MLHIGRIEIARKFVTTIYENLNLCDRVCLQKVTTKCSAALFQGLEATGNLQSADISMVSLERDLESVISKVCLIPKVLVFFFVIVQEK